MYLFIYEISFKSERNLISFKTELYKNNYSHNINQKLMKTMLYIVKIVFYLYY